MTKQSPIPRYRLHRASGQACVVIDGRWFYLGRYGSPASRAEYDRLIAEWLANNRTLPTECVEITVAELILRYWRFAQLYYRKGDHPTSELDKVRQAARPLKPLYGRTAAAQFGPLRLKAVREQMIASGLARSTINSRIAVIKRMFEWAVAEELLPPSVHHALRTVRGLRRGRSKAKETDPVRPVPRAHVQAVLLHLSRQVRAMVQLQLLTGMRPGEVVIMRTCDIDMSKPDWIYRPSFHKTEHHDIPREIVLGPRARDVLRKFLRAEPQAYLFSAREAEASRNAARRAARRTRMTPNQALRKRKAMPKRPPGNRFRTEAYRRAITRACKKAGVPAWCPNRLRHTWATDVRREFGAECAQVLLGHKHLKTTEIYAEADRTRMAEIMAKIG